jgi:hypothetical protein
MELVEEVRRSNPGASIEEILDKSRHLMLQQIYMEIKDYHFETAVHVVEELCDRSLTLEDVVTVLEWFGEFNSEIRDDVRRLIDSRSVSTVYKFFQSEINDSNFRPTCWMRLLCTSSTKRKTRSPS